jgi:hypothetical protein
MASLGFFFLARFSNNENFVRNKLVSYRTVANNITNTYIFFKVFKKIYPIIKSTISNSGIFFFISLSESGVIFFKEFFTFLKRSKVNIIFDWGFGILTNRLRIYVNHYLYGRKHYFVDFPDIAFLMSTKGRQKVVTTELKRCNILSVGIVSYLDSEYVDYPIISNASIQYLFFFYKCALKIIWLEEERFTWFNKKQAK